jgi:hypothetical protein
MGTRTVTLRGVAVGSGVPLLVTTAGRPRARRPNCSAGIAHGSRRGTDRHCVPSDTVEVSR